MGSVSPSLWLREVARLNGKVGRRAGGVRNRCAEAFVPDPRATVHSKQQGPSDGATPAWLNTGQSMRRKQQNTGLADFEFIDAIAKACCDVARSQIDVTAKDQNEPHRKEKDGTTIN